MNHEEEIQSAIREREVERAMEELENACAPTFPSNHVPMPNTRYAKVLASEVRRLRALLDDARHEHASYVAAEICGGDYGRLRGENASLRKQLEEARKEMAKLVGHESLIIYESLAKENASLRAEVSAMREVVDAARRCMGGDGDCALCKDDPICPLRAAVSRLKEAKP